MRVCITTVRVLVIEYQLVAIIILQVVRFQFFKHLVQRFFLKGIDAQDLQNAVETSLGRQLFFHNRYQHINADGDPDLRLHRIVAGAVKVFDAQVLLNPFEKQLHLPSALIQPGYSERRQRKVIRQKDEALARRGVHVMNSTQLVGVVFDAGKVA